MMLFFVQISSASETVPSTDSSLLQSSWPMIQMLVALAIVCLIAWLVLRFLFPKIYASRRSGTSQVKILERIPLEPRKNLYLIQVGTQKVLIGTSEHSVSSLLKLESITDTSLKQETEQEKT